MRAESAESKVAADCKLADARSMVKSSLFHSIVTNDDSVARSLSLRLKEKDNIKGRYRKRK